jgi:hypothetical protein
MVTWKPIWNTISKTGKHPAGEPKDDPRVEIIAHAVKGLVEQRATCSSRNSFHSRHSR